MGRLTQKENLNTFTRLFPSLRIKTNRAKISFLQVADSKNAMRPIARKIWCRNPAERKNTRGNEVYLACTSVRTNSYPFAIS